MPTKSFVSVLRAVLIASLCLSISLPLSGVASEAPLPDLPGQSDLFGELDAFGTLGSLDTEGEQLRLRGELRIQRGSRSGTLAVQAQLTPPWHVYALTQKGGPGPSRITVGPEDAIEVLGPFQPDQAPETRRVEEFDVPLQEHYGQVVWSAPIRLAEGIDADQVQLDVRFDGLICHDQQGCVPVPDTPVEVTFAGYTESEQAAATATAESAGGVRSYRAARSHATLVGHVQPAAAAPGGTVRVVMSAVTEPTWHVYAYAPRDPDEIAKPTLIAVDQPSGWAAGPVEASLRPVEEVMIPGDPPVRYYDGPVSWTFDVRVPEEAQAGAYVLNGLIGYQTCTNNGCDPPLAARFSATVTVGSDLAAGPANLLFQPAKYAEAAKLAEAVNRGAAAAGQDLAAGETGGEATDPTTAPAAFDLDNLKLNSAGGERPLFSILAIAFVGGFILNFMPCVLPVIGLKIMSFVQQAGESRGRVFALNLWYSLGLISVFMVLATMAAVWNFGWGEQFNFDIFNIVMVAVVFAMGLSFLGIWEIPIPGFVGSGAADELARKEGPLGAFVKGAITTVLATPCSGPGLAVALAWCTGKPVPLVYTVFAVMGLGMASPYLVIGANPGLARFIPKPGAWMETFKQLMGFVLLGTVIYILTFIDSPKVVPTLAFLFGLWAACWWIGRTPISAEFPVKARAWMSAIAFSALIGLIAFSQRFGIGDYSTYGLYGIMEYRLAADVDRQVQKRLNRSGAPETPIAETAAPEPGFELPWQPFSEARLQDLVSANKTVLVDFTADWCLTCKFLERTVLNTREVRQVVEANEVVPLVADWTDRDPEIAKMMGALGSKQVPVIAIFPAGRPNEPIVLMGGYTKRTLIGKLEAAGPSKTAASATSRVALAAEEGF